MPFPLGAKYQPLTPSRGNCPCVIPSPCVLIYVRGSPAPLPPLILAQALVAQNGGGTLGKLDAKNLPPHVAAKVQAHRWSATISLGATRICAGPPLGLQSICSLHLRDHTLLIVVDRPAAGPSRPKLHWPIRRSIPDALAS